MMILVSFDVQCDWPECGEWTHGAVGIIHRRHVNITASEARENSERVGFSRRKLPNGDMGDVCLKHRRNPTGT